jgi:List-Bact-rpt repeat protein/PKD domain-containing protein
VGAAVLAAVLVGGVVLGGVDNGDPVQDVRLLSGAAWLPSARVGQVTLLDGSSAEVSAQVQVAPAGNVLDVVQQGATAYAIDQTAGTVRRVDGATFDLTPPAAPIPDAHAGLTAIPGRDSLYTLDTRRGVVADTDPHTLARRGDLLALAGQLTAGTTTVDDTGTLWAIDTVTGDLTRVAGGRRTIEHQVTRPGRSILAMSNGHPVVVDTTARKAITIDGDTGQVRDSFDLDLHTDDTVQVTGSPRSERLYLVVGRGVLTICDLAAGNCDKTVPLDAGSKFGAAVEAGNRLFVPDYTTGQVWIVDLAQSRVTAKPAVLSRPGQFQLLTRDGVVFYNDVDTEHAGVIHLDGTVARTTKYNPDNPAKGVTTPIPAAANNPQPDKPQPDKSNAPLPNPQPGTPSVPIPRPTDPPASPAGLPTNPTQPPPANPANPDNPNNPSNPNNPPNNPIDPPADPGNPAEPQLKIVMSNVSPTAGEAVTLRVENSAGDAPTGAHWTFGDGGQGDGVTTSHAWTTPRPTGYMVAVVVTLPDNRERTISVNVPVSAKPTVTLTVAIPGGGGAVSGGGINCPGVCSVAVDPNTQITLTAQPDANHLLGTWTGGACVNSRSATCVVTMNANTTVSYQFDNPIRTVTLTVTRPTSGSIRNGAGTPPIACGGIGGIGGTTCSATVNQGTQIQLGGAPDQNHEFSSWGGACAGQGITCVLTMNKDETVSATFIRTLPPVISSLNCEFSGNNKFFCDVVAQSNGGQVEWIIENNPAPQFDGQNSINSTCGRTVTGIKVMITNRAGNDTASTSVTCSGEPK